MGELHTGPKYPLSSADPESYFDLRVVPLDNNKKERATVGAEQYKQAYSGQVGLVCLDRLPTKERGPPIVNPQVFFFGVHPLQMMTTSSSTLKVGHEEEESMCKISLK